MPPYLVWLVGNNQRNRIDSLLRHQKSMDSTLRTETHFMNFTIRLCRAAEELFKIYKIIQTMYVTFLTRFLCQAIGMYPENPEGTKVIAGSMNIHCQESN